MNPTDPQCVALLCGAETLGVHAVGLPFVDLRGASPPALNDPSMIDSAFAHGLYSRMGIGAAPPGYGGETDWERFIENVAAVSERDGLLSLGLGDEPLEVRGNTTDELYEAVY